MERLFVLWIILTFFSVEKMLGGQLIGGNLNNIYLKLILYGRHIFLLLNKIRLKQCKRHFTNI